MAGVWWSEADMDEPMFPAEDTRTPRPIAPRFCDSAGRCWDDFAGDRPEPSPSPTPADFAQLLECHQARAYAVGVAQAVRELRSVLSTWEVA